MRSSSPLLQLILVLAALSLLACNENSLHTLPGDAAPPVLGDDDDSDDENPVDDDDDATGDPYDDPVDDDDVGIEEPPPWRDDCPPEALQEVDFYGPNGEDEIYVLDSSPTEAVATMEVSVAGLYAVYDTAVYESGGSQTNETGYLRIRNDSNPEGVPTLNNCGDEYIIQDNDNSGSPPAALIYLGTFPLDAGANEVTLHHFCPLYRNGECEGFHIGAPDDPSGCSGNGPNSLHMSGHGICLIPR